MASTPTTAGAYDRSETRTRLMSAVEDIRDTLAGCADEAEASGFYPERGWRAMHDSGLFRMKAPRELGGFEADPMTQIDVFEEVSRIDSSAGWTLFVGAGTLAMISGWVQDSALDAFLVDGRLPRVVGGVVPSATAVPVDGGFRVTGRWGFGSGSAHAERFAGNAVIEGEHDPPVLGFFFQPEDVTLHDNWKVNALRGTGSQDISVTDLFVPHHHTFNPFAPSERGGALLRIAIPGLFAMEHGAFALGVARRALDEMAELAKTKSRGYIVPQGVAARAVFQYDLGRAETALSAAHNQLVAVNEEAWAMAEAGDASDPGIQTKLRCASVFATEVGIDVCRTMFRYAGARSLYAGNVIERCMRDVVAGAQHGMVNDVAYEARGQIVLGVEGVAALN
jgi:alkylation response protein AidB-like acyl-CoA dehydrogenase